MVLLEFWMKESPFLRATLNFGQSAERLTAFGCCDLERGNGKMEKKPGYR